MAYSLDMRQRALSLVKQGSSRPKIAEMLGISVSSIRRWETRAQGGQLAAQYPKSRGGYRVDDAALEEYVAQHPDAYQREIGAALNLPATTVKDALKRLKITLKKKTPQYRERDEEKRAAYEAAIADYESENRIYS